MFMCPIVPGSAVYLFDARRKRRVHTAFKNRASKSALRRLLSGPRFFREVQDVLSSVVREAEGLRNVFCLRGRGKICVPGVVCVWGTGSSRATWWLATADKMSECAQATGQVRQAENPL